MHSLAIISCLLRYMPGGWDITGCLNSQQTAHGQPHRSEGIWSTWNICSRGYFCKDRGFIPAPETNHAIAVSSKRQERQKRKQGKGNPHELERTRYYRSCRLWCILIPANSKILSCLTMKYGNPSKLWRNTPSHRFSERGDGNCPLSFIINFRIKVLWQGLPWKRLYTASIRYAHRIFLLHFDERQLALPEYYWLLERTNGYSRISRETFTDDQLEKVFRGVPKSRIRTYHWHGWIRTTEDCSQLSSTSFPKRQKIS